MASITSLTNSSSSSSLYGSRNVISGLSSGLDTEAMIENSIQGYKTKISELEQQQTKVEWKQDAIRLHIDSANEFMNKYSSSTSRTNLSSASFFKSATTTAVSGTYASRVSASGKSASDIQVLSASTATAARYTVNAAAFSGAATGTKVGSQLDWSKSISNVAGTFRLSIPGGIQRVDPDTGNTDTVDEVEITLGDNEFVDNSENLAKVINDKLKDMGYNIVAHAETENIPEGAAAPIRFTNEDGTAVQGLQITQLPAAMQNDRNFSINSGSADTFNVGQTQQSMAEYLSGQTISVKLTSQDQAVTFTIGDLTGAEDKNLALVQSLSAQLANEFGEDVTVDLDAGFLRFSSSEGMEVESVTSSADGLGIIYGSADSLNTNAKIGDILADGWDGDGNMTMRINDAEITINQNSSLSSVFSTINNSAAGVTVHYSSLTHDVSIVSNKTGSGTIRFDDAASRLFGENAGGEHTAGSNAMLNAIVNGKEVTVQDRSNQFNLDGMSLTVKGSFSTGAAEEPLTFQTSADSDKIVDAVKSFVDDYNAMVKSLYLSFNTQPATKSNGSAYAPLTDSDKESMSESAIAAYEENAKKGILFGDSDLRSMFNSLRSAITSTDKATQQAMLDMGLTTEYSEGVTVLKLNEDKLRTALDKDPDAAKKVFADSASYGANDGLASRVKTVMDKYANTSIARTGSLVKRAGTKLSSTSLLSNDMLREINKIQTKIDDWNTKMAKKIDYYTSQFTTLEKLMNQMNSQSSSLSGMLGGY